MTNVKLEEKLTTLEKIIQALEHVHFGLNSLRNCDLLIKLGNSISGSILMYLNAMLCIGQAFCYKQTYY
jgi:hypothetical protein